ncbi:flavin reductase [Mucilaginibacter sp. PPCGB 2223]|uniref:flavin reductase family protein n=1 Tax=Mucilaginibacter sp. PPCGB 2223 TaxID=1886027 RepID=UPI000825F4AE|nr:flavin reductase family protein [Mucilaginibacter sp. PPCGB 2223]OCX52741.1 flavin reductase [Mucilaginibacter sp. PPCGB 2223]
MKTLSISNLTPVEIQTYLNAAIAPRPICFASTVDKDGSVNLSPFSYFNIFSVNPPMCIFSPSRRVSNGTTKHTLQNILEVPEVVINIVNYDMVQQTSLASVEYPKGVNEFVKAGFTELMSELVRPPRVAESPVQLECLVKEVIALGEQNGAGNLILCEVKLIHIQDDVLDENGKIDQEKMDHVARLGADWYCRVTDDNLFRVEKPVRTVGIGVDSLPAAIRNSAVLTGNNLGQLGNVEALPTDEEVETFSRTDEMKELLDATIGDSHTRTVHLHLKAKHLLDNGQVKDAWKVLLM